MARRSALPLHNSVTECTIEELCHNKLPPFAFILALTSYCLVKLLCCRTKCEGHESLISSWFWFCWRNGKGNPGGSMGIPLGIVGKPIGNGIMFGLLELELGRSFSRRSSSRYRSFRRRSRSRPPWSSRSRLDDWGPRRPPWSVGILLLMAEFG